MAEQLEIIMEEFKDIVQCKNPCKLNEQEIYRLIGKISMWLAPAVKREICRAADKLAKDNGKDTCTSWDHVRAIFRKHYSPAPTYCEWMKNAISYGMIKIHNKDFNIVSKDESAHISINRCPFCEEGKNCIGDNAKLKTNPNMDAEPDSIRLGDIK